MTAGAGAKLSFARCRKGICRKIGQIAPCHPVCGDANLRNAAHQQQQPITAIRCAFSSLPPSVNRAIVISGQYNLME
jgi:hypothetical protein